MSHRLMRGRTVHTVGALDMLEARSKDDFRGRLIRLAADIGFDTVSATSVADHPDGTTTFNSVHNTPARYLDVFNDRRASAGDPVMQFCKRHSTPIAWSRATYLHHGAENKYETQAAYGYRHGIALALHLPFGKHFFLGVDRDQPLPTHPAELERLTGTFVLLALHAQVAASTVLAEHTTAPDMPTLTPRELEVLRWTLAGKTAWEVGMLLSISERTAAIHANRATHKLGCTSKHQAALKALHAGLISGR